MLDIQPEGFPGLPADWSEQPESVDVGEARIFRLRFLKEPRASPRALWIVHGMGEHAGRYRHFPHFLQDEVDSITVTDHRGHGRSSGSRGYVGSFDDYARDAAALLRIEAELLQQRFGSHEIHLFGHSMGGMVVLRMLLGEKKLPIRSVSLSAPVLGVKVPIPGWKRALGKFLARTWDSLPLPSEVDPSAVSRDAAASEAYRTDRLVHNKVTPRLFVELERVIEETPSRLEEILENFQGRFGIFVPMADRIVDSERTLEWASKLPLDRVRVHRYDEYFHEAFNDIGKERFFEDLAKWIRENRA